MEEDGEQNKQKEAIVVVNVQQQTFVQKEREQDGNINREESQFIDKCLKQKREEVRKADS